MASQKEIAERLEEVPLFSRCSKKDRRIVARHTQVMEAATGTVVVRQGDNGDACFVLLSGTAAVEVNGKPIADLGPGDYFGELALLDPAPRSATVIATADCELAVLGIRMFKVLLRELPDLGAKLLADLAARVRPISADY